MSQNPNILWICVDQQRWDCLGYAEKYPVKTPNIDRLAAGGVNLANSYCPIPVCCPSRQSMLTGKRAEQIGALWNYNQKIYTGMLPADSQSWARELRDRLGYHTGWVGPWEGGYNATPASMGYDVYVPRSELVRPMAEKYPHCVPTNGFWGQVYDMDKEYAPTHQLAGQVVSLMEGWQDEHPWLVQMEFSEPHLPCTPVKEFADLYDPADIPVWGGFEDAYENKPYIQRQQRINWNTEDKDWAFFAPIVARYYAWISQIDDAIGRVLDWLEAHGKLQDTVIIYPSDHGDYCGDRRQMDKHYAMYEEITHIPHLWHCPARFVQGLTSHALNTNALDIPVTIMDMLGLPTDGMVGKSLLPVLKGETDAHRDAVMVTYNGQQFGLFSQRMLRMGDIKYTWNLTDTDELYDLASDPYELHNLISDPDYAETLQSMRHRLLAELQAENDCMLNSWTEQQLRLGRKL